MSVAYRLLVPGSCADVSTAVGADIGLMIDVIVWELGKKYQR
jgi:hypothetical protein